ncbi:phosphoenolpyruvate synthase [Ostreiculturibacter nitratireducens]|uniref:phosphoenolpyruvate synthase n=1 Tax=Ostreiculturibacter nitratireducens TaxID=3075226 RepID=UPI0031B593FE
MAEFVRWFSDLTIEDVPLVGGKNASLGEMYRELTPLGVKQANGFAVTAEGYRAALDAAGAWEKLHRELDGLDKSDVRALHKAGQSCREIVYAAGLTPQVRDEILEAMEKLYDEYGNDISVAVRSSATAEDLPTASFAGQHDTYLNIAGNEMVLDAVTRCNASLFTDRAISYRIDKGFDHFKVYLSACVMKMIRSDLASSGVMFTVDTESGHPDFVFITSAFGLGENVVQGAVDVDEFLVHKPRFRDGFRAVTRRVLGAKQMKMVYAAGRTREPIVNKPTSAEEQAAFSITDDQALVLADYAIKIEDHYSRHRGHTTPMDIEWALDGKDNELYIVQARPETVTSQADANVMEEYVVTGKGETRVTGRAVGTKCALGKVRVIRSTEQLSEFKPGEVLVSDTTTPDWEPVMKTAAAIVTNRGGRTCHAAIVARELGIPAVVGAEGATATLKDGETVTISCAEGDVGRVYAGEVPFETRRTDLATLKKPKTHIMVNLGNPELALKTSFLPVDGVGLARLEFIINEYIKAHPMALLHPDKVEDREHRAAIDKMVQGHANGGDFFVQRLSEGVGTIAAAFWPRPVIARLSDFKSNEYAQLIGGAPFEPKEENPMIGFRGAARYTHPSFEEAFVLECRAMARVRDEMGLTNLKLMIPFCRRVDEADRVIEFMGKHGLERGKNGLEIYVMCEIPNNVIAIDEFAKRFDGFSIGSNDLTQLTLGVDRDSQIVAFDFDERDPGVMAFLKQAVDGAKRNGRHVGICGQAPSDYPEMARYLVDCGIDSISLTPDSVLKTLQMVAEMGG